MLSKMDPQDRITDYKHVHSVCLDERFDLNEPLLKNTFNIHDNPYKVT